MAATGHYWKNLFAVAGRGRAPSRAAQPAAPPALPGAGPARAPGPTRSTRSASPASPARSARRRPGSARPSTEELQGSWCAIATGSSRTSTTGYASCTAGSTSASPSSRATSARSTASSPAQSSPTTRPPRRSPLAAPHRLAKLRYDGRHKVGPELARQLVAAAKRSVGQHHGPAYRIQVQDICQDLDLWRRRLKAREGDIERLLEDHEVGRLLTTIDGIGPLNAARSSPRSATRRASPRPRHSPPTSASSRRSSSPASASPGAPA